MRHHIFLLGTPSMRRVSGATTPLRSAASSGRDGAAVIELAIVLPLLLTIVFGCIDFGRFAYAYIALSNAAREAAYLAATTPIPSDSERMQTVWERAVKATVTGEMADVPGFDPQHLEVALPSLEIENAHSRRVAVSVSYPFHTIVPFPRLDNAITLQRTVAMRMIR
jgi:hypothetical protein